VGQFGDGVLRNGGEHALDLIEVTIFTAEFRSREAVHPRIRGLERESGRAEDLPASPVQLGVGDRGHGFETIAHEPTTAAGDPATLVHDPYVAVIPRQGAVFGSTHDIYVLDRNTVIKGARYQYLLVRMGADAEPEEVLATLPVTIPLNP
jgi:hypothetical protein